MTGESIQEARINAATADTATNTATLVADATPATSLRDKTIQIARLMADTKCGNVRVLDLRGVSPVCDYFVLGTGTSVRQMRTVADEVSEYGQENGLRSYGKAGVGENWIAIDLVHVVVHVFSHEGRMHYDLDNLWADANDVEWKRPT